jgi:hypothetical protein
VKPGHSALPVGLAAVAGATSAATILLAVTEHRLPGQPPVTELVSQAVASIGMASIGALLAARRRQSPLGWLLLAIGVETALVQCSYRYGVRYLLHAGQVPPPPESPSATSHLPDLLNPMLAGLLFLWFPTGRPPTPRWRHLGRLAVLLAVVGVGASLLIPGQLPDVPGFTNPLGVQSLGRAATAVRNTAGGLLNPVFVVAVMSLVFRWRRSKDIEREQVKWLTAAATLVAIFLVVSVIAGTGAFGSIGKSIAGGFFFAILLLPIAVAMAVFRYRLYDINVVLSRALVFATLAGFVTAVYLTVVVGFGALVSSNGRPNVALSIAATALTALAFQPVRVRAHRLANRLVYGERATPYEVLSGFASRAGDLMSPEEQLQRVAQLLS